VKGRGGKKRKRPLASTGEKKGGRKGNRAEEEGEDGYDSDCIII